ncbi:sugar phosphate isomerase/epimerase (plasmid) [Azospirillum sp. TSA2s]|uniref:sugar phosphate isomerase/epimerase family protein n=1 Tax=Azospirillum sp. TSA2s TaxID=709810 RepID=UPI0010AAFF37|nr:TIM barrel protein [Azospirillum sp. TSA2s]QCG93014.1 sugar phosphate isomerase/epimerase [Azospirillum sp. TSA2s]
MSGVGAPARLAVSNIAWECHDDPAVLDLLRRQGVTGIEVAPPKIWPGWEGATPAAARAYRERLAGEGFAIPALQAILFGKSEPALFGSPLQRTALLDHLSLVADLAAALGAHAVVFGAPKLRNRGTLPEEAAFAVAVETFAAAGALFAARDTTLCFEPNPPQYGCTLGTTSDEAAQLVAAVASPGFCLHLDSAALVMADEDVPSAVRRHAAAARHAHASEPDLGTFAAPKVDHAGMARALAEGGYAGWLSIEMRQAAEDPSAALAQACAVVRAAYAPLLDAPA